MVEYDAGGEFEPEGQKYGMTVHLGYRGSAEYAGGKNRDQTVHVRVGVLKGSDVIRDVELRNDGRLQHNPYCEIVLNDSIILKKLFSQASWPRAPTNAPEDQTLNEMDGYETLSVTFHRPKIVANKSHCACFLASKGKAEDEEVWVQQANFEIVENLAIYNFTDGKSSPFYKILARQLLDPRGEGTLYMPDEMENRGVRTDGYKWLDVEVIVSSVDLKCKSDVTGCFGRQYGGLITGVMEPDILFSFILSNPKPPIETCIAYFGRQPDNTFVAGNCCLLSGGKYCTLQEAGISIIAKQFEEAIISVPRSDYPRHIICELPHVRYYIATRLWNDVMPEFFLNNLLPARAVLAFAVMGLHSSKIWSGETGLGHGCPFAWVYSTEHNTGKTEAVMLAHCLTGGYRRSLWSGDVSKPAICERLAHQRDMAVIVDDVVLNKSSESKAFMQLGRGVYDRVTRAVCGKTRTPQSTIMFTSNTLCNESDNAFQSRQILIKFDELKEDGIDCEIPNLFTEWMSLRELSSCLMMDFEALLMPNGKLDDEAIGDCATFLQTYLHVQRDRTANCYAILLYYMLMLNYLLQADCDTQHDTIHFVCRLARRSMQTVTKRKSLLERFLAALDKLRIGGETGNMSPLGPIDKTIFWDKLRYDQFTKNGKNYMSFRVNQCIEVIHTILGEKFSTTTLNEAISGSTRCVRGTALFVDTALSGWPLAKNVFDVNMQTSQAIPMTEDELPHEWVKTYPCVHVLVFDGNTVFEEEKLDDLPSIKIKSKNSSAEPYHFMDSVTGQSNEPWFGYRAVLQTPYADYCATDLLLVGSPAAERDPRTEICQLQQGFLEDFYNPLKLLNTFGYDFICLDRLAPCYQACPFKSRDALCYNDPPDIQRLIDPMSMNVDDALDMYSGDEMGHDEDSQQAGDTRPLENDVVVGSTPLGDRNQGSSEPERARTSRAKKRRRALITDDDDDENSCPSQAHIPAPLPRR